MNRKFIVLFVCAGFLSGCALLKNPKGIRTLQNLAKEQERNDKYVENKDKQFEELLAATRSNSLDQYKDKKSILKNFGDPIMVSIELRNDKNLERWVYRYTVKFFDSEKIYLYFDHNNTLVEWEYIPKEEKGQEQST